MKKFLIVIIVSFFLINVFNGVFAAETEDQYFTKYQEDTEKFCKNTDPNVSPWFNNMKYFLQQDAPPYTDFMDENIDKKYDDYLQKIGLQGLSNTLDLLTSGPFEKAKLLYTETQNSIFNCAILKTKLKIGRSVLTYISKNDGTSNTITKIEKQNTMITQELSNKKCTTIGITDENTGYKVDLLNNITYEYCIYKQYLNYLNSFLNNSINQYVTKKQETQKDFFQNWEIQDLSSYLVQQKDIIQNEDAHARNVYKQSLIAFQEFENTYGSHLMLVFIYDDYIQVRNNMKKLLNPISQLIYKIPQAQKQ